MPLCTLITFTHLLTYLLTYYSLHKLLTSAVLSAALIQVKKALRQARAARTVAIIIGGFLACWTPYPSVLLKSK